MAEKNSETADRKQETGKKWAREKKTGSIIKINIYGRQPVLEALRAQVRVEKVWLTEGLQGPSVQQIKNFLSQKEIPAEQIRKDAIQKIVGAVVHQGVAAEVLLKLIDSEQKFEAFLEKRENPLLLVLDQIQDPHNLGAILRTAEISGVDAVIMPLKGSAEINATVAKTSAGALFHIPIYRSENLIETLNTLQSKKIQIIATMPRAETAMYQADFKIGTAIMVGNEGQGVRKNLLPFTDQAIYIPQKGRLNSLNASVSTAVVLYEALRQRHT